MCYFVGVDKVSNISESLKKDLEILKTQQYSAFSIYSNTRQETGVSCKYCGVIQLSSKELCAHCGAPLYQRFHN